MRHRPNPAWDLPQGVAPGTWDYTESDHIASDYDRYFADAGMFRVDAEVIDRWCGSMAATKGEKFVGRVVDLGAGTGRASLRLALRGFDCLAVDLSQPMLDQIQAKREALGLTDGQMGCVRANLVQLDCLPAEYFDIGLCLFSTLGMIHGNASRQQALSHAARLLRPSGFLVLQVHNYWVQLFDPEGPGVMWRNACRRWLHGDVEIGTKSSRIEGSRTCICTRSASESSVG